MYKQYRNVSTAIYMWLDAGTVKKTCKWTLRERILISSTKDVECDKRVLFPTHMGPTEGHPGAFDAWDLTLGYIVTCQLVL